MGSSFLVGTVRCVVRAAFSGAIGIRSVVRASSSVAFRPLNAGGDIAAQSPGQPSAQSALCVSLALIKSVVDVLKASVSRDKLLYNLDEA